MRFLARAKVIVGACLQKFTWAARYVKKQIKIKAAVHCLFCLRCVALRLRQWRRVLHRQRFFSFVEQDSRRCRICIVGAATCRELSSLCRLGNDRIKTFEERRHGLRLDYRTWNLDMWRGKKGRKEGRVNQCRSQDIMRKRKRTRVVVLRSKLSVGLHEGAADTGQNSTACIVNIFPNSGCTVRALDVTAIVFFLYLSPV